MTLIRKKSKKKIKIKRQIENENTLGETEEKSQKSSTRPSIENENLNIAKSIENSEQKSVKKRKKL